jgi:2,3-bisphosphoglycerate-independent phosphoglycerate mutase
MKYVVLIGDGMADDPQEQYGGKTPLEAAKTPNLDRLSRSAVLGLVRTVPVGMNAGSDVANLSILGYDPRTHYTGRAPIEAAGLGVELKPGETALRCNLVSLRREGHRLVMDDYSAGQISNEEAAELMVTIQEKLGRDGIKFYPSVSYRNLCVIRGFDDRLHATPPHDFMNGSVDEHWPGCPGASLVRTMVEASQKILAEHPVNVKRRKQGLKCADSIWLWGHGTMPKLKTIPERDGLHGVMISGVDLLRGLGKLAGLEVIRVPGATADIHTNYEGKVAAALDALRKQDFVYLHVEAPDEAAHQGNLAEKVEAIELFDRRVVGPMIEGMQKSGQPFRMLIMPDHMTPVKERTHRDGPVPFMIVDSKQVAPKGETGPGFNERAAAATKLLIEKGDELLGTHLFQKG